MQSLAVLLWCTIAVMVGTGSEKGHTKQTGTRVCFRLISHRNMYVEIGNIQRHQFSVVLWSILFGKHLKTISKVIEYLYFNK